MKKMMIIAAVAVAMAMGVYAEEAAAPKAEVKVEKKCCGGCGGKKADAKVCEACVKLNKDLKAGEQPKYCCDACKAKAEEAAAAAAKKSGETK